MKKITQSLIVLSCISVSGAALSMDSSFQSTTSGSPTITTTKAQTQDTHTGNTALNLPNLHGSTTAINPLPKTNLASQPVAKKMGKAIIVGQDKNVVKLRLAANPTTGFQWFVRAYNHHLLNLLTYQYQAPETDRVGAGGTAVFTFAVEPAFQRAPQLTHIVLENGQAWDLASMQKHIVTVVSTGSNATTASHGAPMTDQAISKPIPRYSTNAPVTAPHHSEATTALPKTNTHASPSDDMQKVPMPALVGEPQKPTTSSTTLPATKEATSVPKQDDWLALPVNDTPSKK